MPPHDRNHHRQKIGQESQNARHDYANDPDKPNKDFHCLSPSPPARSIPTRGGDRVETANAYASRPTSREKSTSQVSSHAPASAGVPWYVATPWWSI